MQYDLNQEDFELKNNCAEFPGYQQLLERLEVVSSDLKAEKSELENKLDSDDWSISKALLGIF